MANTIALVGRPNVGKSTFFNRLVGKQLALVDDTPGLTRDRKMAEARLGGYSFTLVDTPGLEEGNTGSLAERLRQQSMNAIRDADLVFFLVDAVSGITPLDEKFARWLRPLGKPVVLLANKCEGKAGQAGWHDAYRLGYGEPLPVSAAHGQGLEAVADVIGKYIKPDAPEETEEETGDEEDENWRDKPMHLAIVGRPNAGKSTLINALLGEDRMLTGPEAGLTRDSIHIPWEWQGRKIRLVDTAGLRRKAKIEDRLEKMAVGETMRAVRLAHVVVLVLDATQSLDHQDLAIAQHAEREGRALVLAVNKWDAVEDKNAAKKRVVDRLTASFSQLRGMPVVYLSAKKSQKLDELMSEILRIEEVWNTRVKTGELNRWLVPMTEHNAPPMVMGRRIKIRYLTQLKARPPTFALWLNKPLDLPETYLRYMASGLRERFNLPGVPLRFILKKGKNPYEGKKNEE